MSAPQNIDDLKIFTNVISWSLSTLIVLVYIPLCIFGVICLFKHINNNVIKKRQPYITLHITITGVFELICVVPIIMSYPGYYNEFPIVTLFYILLIDGVIILIWFAFLRVYMYYYNLKYREYMIDNEWKSIINNSDHSNWYYNNKDTFGSFKYILKYIYIIILLSLTILDAPIILVYIFYGNSIGIFVASIIVLNLLIIIPLGLIIVIHFKTPILSDVFKIRLELRHLIRLGSYMVIYNWVHTFLYMFIPQHIQIYLLYFFWFSFTTCITVLVWLSTLFVIKINAKSLRPGFDNLTSQQHVQMAMKMDRISSVDSAQNSQIISLADLLKNEKYLSVFMKHLNDEFSLEILCFIIEVHQYQQKIRFIWNDHSLKSKCDLTFCVSTPTSDIVHTKLNDDIIKNETDETRKTILELMLKAHKIYSKYVKHNSKYSINISYMTRNPIINEMNNLNEWIKTQSNKIDYEYLYYYFDECKLQVYSLVHYSFERFKAQPQYFNICQNI